MYNTERELVEVLRVGPHTLATLIRGLDAQQLRSVRGGDEGWTIVEVICHLRDTEAIVLERMRSLRDSPTPQIDGFDQEALARERNYAAADYLTACEEFARVRAQHVEELAALSPEQWQRCGQHRTLGEVSILNHSLHMVWHDAIHMAQIARQLPS